MEDPTRRDRNLPTTSSRCRQTTTSAVVTVVAGILAGCSVVAIPDSSALPGSRGASAGPVGYVVCPTAVTPVELRTRTPEAPIALPIGGIPPLGDFAITTSPDGRWAFVVTQSTLPGRATNNVLVPIDLAIQRAARPIALPGQGATSAVVVMHDGRTVLAASGTTIVPVDVITRAVGTPLDLGSGRTVVGMALSPRSSTLYVLEAGGVVPVATDRATAGSPIITGLTLSSVSSPHGLVVSSDGSTLYVAGQGLPDYGGRVVPIATTTGAVGAPAGFDRYGISDPAALALTPDGSQLLVADSADNWIDTVPVADFANPLAPVRLPSGGTTAAVSGTDHPTDIVTGPGTTGAFIVTGHGTVLPYDPARQTFGRAVRVCSGATSMTVDGTP
jgi:DNA-binding beta-propeller fold protein YncE